MDVSRRYYEVAGITIQVESDLPIADDTFADKFSLFRVSGPGADTVTIRHHFGLPDLSAYDLSEATYRQAPWIIHRSGEDWVYLGVLPERERGCMHHVAVFNSDHSSGDLYADEAREESWRAGGLDSLTMFPTDQILIARLLADRSACLVHSAGLVFDEQGFLFVGHSETGKSTTVQVMHHTFGQRVEILCDDRNVLRRWPEGFRVHGTWSHGDVPDVSRASAEVCAILFLEQSVRNELVRLHDHKDILRRLLPRLVRPALSVDWMEKEMDVVEQVVQEVPCYLMLFDRSGDITSHLEGLPK